MEKSQSTQKYNLRNKKREALKKSVKEHESSSDSDEYDDERVFDSDYDDEDAYSSGSGSGSGSSVSSSSSSSSVEYKKFLYSLFPSKHLKDTIEKKEMTTKNSKKENEKEKEKQKKRITPTPIVSASKSKDKDKEASKKKSKAGSGSSKKKVKEPQPHKEPSLPSNEESYDFENDSYDSNESTLENVSQASSHSHEDDHDDSETIHTDDTHSDTDDENDSDSESDSDDFCSECSGDSMDQDELRDLFKDNMNFNIVFTIGGKNDSDTYDTSDTETDTDTDTDADTDAVSSSENEEDVTNKVKKSQNTTQKQGGKKGVKDAGKAEAETKSETKNSSKQASSKKATSTSKKDTKKDETTKAKAKAKANTNIKTTNKKASKTSSSSHHEETFKKMMKLIESYDDEEDEDVKNEAKKQLDVFIEKERQKKQKKTRKDTKKQQTKNTKALQKLLREKDTTNDFRYFRKLSPEKQQEIIRETQEIVKHDAVDKPHRIALIESSIPAKYKANAMRKINTLRYMDQGSGEYYKIKQWVDTFMRIPFGRYNTLPVKMSDGIEKCNAFMRNAKETLDNAVYGLNDAKMQIMQMLGQWISNPDAVGSAIAIKGPMGTGKTTLVKEGISKILNRPFAFIPLGGATDSSFLEGHSYTYEGSIWGKIVDVLIQNKSMNPVFYFDELDKVSDTPKGEEIIGILTHLTDTTQNAQFHDKYFTDIDFDLSKALFIFSYNDESKVNAILRDRMYRIQTNGYNTKEKTTIAKNYLMPSIEKNVNFKKDEICIDEDAIHYMIENFTDSEKGVRNLRRCLEVIYTKLNLYRLMEKGSSLFDEDEEDDAKTKGENAKEEKTQTKTQTKKRTQTFEVVFPFTVTKEVVDTFLKRNKEDQLWKHMYM